MMAVSPSKPAGVLRSQEIFSVAPPASLARPCFVETHPKRAIIAIVSSPDTRDGSIPSDPGRRELLAPALRTSRQSIAANKPALPGVRQSPEPNHRLPRRNSRSSIDADLRQENPPAARRTALDLLTMLSIPNRQSHYAASENTAREENQVVRENRQPTVRAIVLGRKTARRHFDGGHHHRSGTSKSDRCPDGLPVPSRSSE